MKKPTTTYFALTTGPIFKTLAIAKRTREIWTASYIFSWLTNQIIDTLQTESNRFEIILPVKPVVTNKAEEQKRISAGLYPDRLIVISKGNDMKNWEKFNEIVTKFKDELVNNIKLQTRNSETDSLFVDNFHTYTLQIELNENEDPVAKIFPLLDSLDQQAAYNPVFNNHILKELFKGKDLKNTIFYEKTNHHLLCVNHRPHF